ncbi:Golgi transport complex subunit 3 [Serendipita sp. 401]|nr:Golgi transport complex subunit 3 [Serendipita sp. 401]
MASKRPPNLGTPSVNANTQSQMISLDAWESSVPLQEKQLQSIAVWKHQGEQKPLPLKFEEDQVVPISRPGTPLRTLKQREGSLRPGSRPGTPVLNQSTRRHPLHPAHPISTPQQFHDWFALIERSIQHSQETHFRSHLSQLTEQLDKCTGLTEKVNRVDDDVIRMLSAWKSIEEGGRSLQEASEQLVDEKNRLIEVTDAISARLAYFQELERATRMLNHPGDDVVLQPDFLITVERVDICLEYLQNHRDFREADIYILRFQQCLIRAMSLIKIFFTASFRNLSADVERQLAEKTISTISTTHLLYPKFATMATQMTPLISELERRVVAYPTDLRSLLEECHATYFAIRKSLLTPQIISEVKGLDPAHGDLVELTRAGCGYLRQLCENEFTLYRRFFSSGEDHLYRYLENLCDFLYDDLRPRILHEQRIGILCEVCTVLQALMVLGSDVSNLDGVSDEGEDDQGSIVPETPLDMKESPGMQKLQIGVLLQMILQDAQTRLVFKTQAIVQSDIRLHTPTDDDLRYPDKLIEHRATQVQEPPKGSSDSSDNQEEMQADESTWYPSVRKTAWIMSMLDEFVKPEIFHDIAREAISFCRESLDVASQRMAAKGGPTSAIDAKLFTIYHLLILKELVSEVDFGQDQPAGTAPPLSAGEGFFGIPLFRPAAFLGSLAYLGVPRLLSGAETPLNIDQELKSVCEALISDCVKNATRPVRVFVERSSAYLDALATGPLNEKNDLLSQEFAAPKQALETNNEFKQACKEEVQRWGSRVRLFLEDERTVAALFTPLQHQIIEEYAIFRGLLAGRYGPELLEEAYTETALLNTLRQWLVPPTS